MNPLAGAEELWRKLRRQWWRVILFFLHRRLHWAEIELGWLGWQQADFFDPAIQAQIEKIEQFEREQAQLVNVSAELETTRDDLEKQRLVERAGFETELAGIREARQPDEAVMSEIGNRLYECRAARTRFQNALQKLDDTTDALLQHVAQLRGMDPPTEESNAELFRAEEQLALIPEQTRELRRQRDQLEVEITAAEEQLTPIRERIQASEELERQAQERFLQADRALTDQLHEITRSSTHSEQRMTALDAEKSAPFLIIGRCLADAGIFPRNQPGVLSAVLNLREKVSAAQAQIDELDAESLATGARIRGDLYALIAAIAGLLILLVVAAKWLSR